MMNDKFKKYVCRVPFELLEVHNDKHWLCCPSWIKDSIGNTPTDIDELSFVSIWNSSKAQEIRKSIFEGDYEFCNVEKCPALNTLAYTDSVPSQFIEKYEFGEITGIYNSEDVITKTPMPRRLALNFDRSCNLKCPSCRKELIPFDKPGSADYNRNERIMTVLQEEFGECVSDIFMNGSGEALYNKSLRKFLTDLDDTEFPKLENIHLVTNAQLLNEKMWNSMNARKYITGLNISVDAGTKDTYEKVVRLGGSWDRLIENLKFISIIDTLATVDICMVVSSLNYKEMSLFYDLMYDIFKNSNYEIKITFNQHIFWQEGLYSEEDYKSINIFDTSHTENHLLLQEIKKIHKKPFVVHNFNHLMDDPDEK